MIREYHTKEEKFKMLFKDSRFEFLKVSDYHKGDDDYADRLKMIMGPRKKRQRFSIEITPVRHHVQCETCKRKTKIKIKPCKINQNVFPNTKFLEEIEIYNLDSTARLEIVIRKVSKYDSYYSTIFRTYICDKKECIEGALNKILIAYNNILEDYLKRKSRKSMFGGITLKNNNII